MDGLHTNTVSVTNQPSPDSSLGGPWNGISGCPTIRWPSVHLAVAFRESISPCDLVLTLVSRQICQLIS